VALAADGQSIASHCAADGLLKLWKTNDASERTVLGAHGFILSSVAIAPDERTLVSGDLVGEIRVWDFATRSQLKALRESDEPCRQLLYTRDGRWLIAVLADGQAMIWNTVDWTLRYRLQLKGVSTSTVAVVTPDGQELLTIANDGLIGYQVGSFRETVRLRPAVANPLALALSPNGSVLATYHGGRVLELTEYPSGRPLGRLASDLDWVAALTFNDDGRLLAAACGDGSVRIWDVANRLPYGSVMRHDLPAAAVVFLTGSNRLISGSEDRTIRIWDLESCQPRGTLLLPDLGGVFGLAVTADGRRIVSVDGDAQVRLWQAASPQEVAAAESRSGP
jgi:WD40 repeat protein